MYQKTGVPQFSNGAYSEAFFDSPLKRPFYDTVLDVMRTAIYARVSTKDGRQDADNQLRELRAFAETQGWTLVREYVDRASGKRGDREQFEKMFVAASRREFDCLLFWSLDRLSREGTLETLNHLQRLTQYGVNYRSFTGVRVSNAPCCAASFSGELGL
jgi:DNA invertase Pin-like site-specific DNA recombinase